MFDEMAEDLFRADWGFELIHVGQNAVLEVDGKAVSWFEVIIIFFVWEDFELILGADLLQGEPLACFNTFSDFVLKMTWLSIGWTSEITILFFFVLFLPYFGTLGCVEWRFGGGFSLWIGTGALLFEHVENVLSKSGALVSWG